MKLYVSVPPAIAPVSLYEALDHCRCDPGIEDDWFTAAIKSATKYARSVSAHSFITQTIVASYDILHDNIELPYGPVQSVSGISVFDISNTESVCDLSDFYIDVNNDPASINLNYNAQWPTIVPRVVNALKITYVAGYGDSASDIPEDIRFAILMCIGYLYENRDASIESIPAVIRNLLMQDKRTW